VWDENTRKPIRCKFEPKYEDKIKTLLRSNVIVSGILNANSAGNPVYIDVEDIQLQTDLKLPTINEMSGLVDDFTEGKSLRGYLEELDE
jgi:hypothetical protein